MLPAGKRCFLAFFKEEAFLLVAVKKAPIASLNAIVINSQLTKECDGSASSYGRNRFED